MYLCVSIATERKGEFATLNLRKASSACCAHEDETGTDDSAQVLIGRTEKLSCAFLDQGSSRTVAAFTESQTQLAKPLSYGSCWVDPETNILKASGEQILVQTVNVSFQILGSNER